MILKHRDREVLRFDWQLPFGVKNLEVNTANLKYLPLAFRDRPELLTKEGELRYQLELWFLARLVPMKRQGIKHMLRQLGFEPDDPHFARNLIEFCRGLTLNDVHWIVRDEDTAKWSEVNLYENEFSSSVASLAFAGERPDVVRKASSSPEYTTNGNLAKCWRRRNGEIFLYKGAGRGEEPHAEYLAAQVAAAMGLNHVDYGLSTFKGQLCSTCKLFTSDKFGFLPMRDLLDRESRMKDPQFADMFFFDAVVGNTDRHYGNFGYLIDNDTNELSAPAPIFDNGYAFQYAKHPMLFDSWLDIPGGITEEMVARLKPLKNFVFKSHPGYNLPPSRVESILENLRRQIDIIEKNYKNPSVKIENLPVKCTKTPPKKHKTEPKLTLDEEMLAALKLFPFITKVRLAQMFEVSPMTIVKHLKSLQERGVLKRIGPKKGGHWQVA